MPVFEKRIVDFIKKNSEFIFFVFISAFALAARYLCIDFVSGDYVSFLKPWFQTIEQYDGFHALGLDLGDYNVPYLVIMVIIHYLPIGRLTMLKTVSFMFDFLLAGCIAYLVYSLTGKNKKFYALIAYSITLFSLPVFLNSSVWCQCDSIYTAFALLSIIFLIKDKPVFAFVAYGIAFAFKIQSVFILPVFILLYIINKKYSIVHFLIIPAVNIVLCIPAFIAGRSFTSVFSIYLKQASEYKAMTLNFPNLYSLVLKEYDAFSIVAILIAVCIMGIGALFVLKFKNEIKPVFLLELSAWYIWTCVLFLPAMHDRYAYMLCAVTIALMFVKSKRIWVAVACNVVSICAYCPFLLGYSMFEERYVAVVNLAAYLVYSYVLAKEAVNEKPCDDCVKQEKISETQEIREQEKVMA